MSEIINFFPKGSYPRPQQVKAISKIEEIWKKGKKIAIACLPTGSGKSHIAKTIAESSRDIPENLKELIENYSIYKKNKDNEYNVAEEFLKEKFFGSFILTITKSLQNQYSNLFFETKLIKGKSNYICDVDNGFKVDFAPCSLLPSQKQECFSENRCPYYKARNEGLISKSSVLNYSVYLNLPDFLQKRQILIMDEAAELEDELVNQYTLSISYRNLRYEKIPFKPLLNDNLNSAYIWIQDLYNSIKNEYEDYFLQAQKKSIKAGFDVISQSLSIKILKLSNMLSNMELVLNNWKKCEYLVESLDKEKVVFAPYNIKYLTNQIFEKADKILMMSATISNPKEFAKSLGIHENDYEYFEIESTFDSKNSPILCSTKYALSYKTMEKMLPEVVKTAKTICDKHSKEKGLIHTHTNKITQEFKKQFGNNFRFLYREEGLTNESIIKEHFESSDPTVLISPSMDTGVSLDDHFGRFQIIVKAPYLPLNSNRIKKMFKENPEYYTSKMMDKLIQMCGRCTRSKEDYSVTYILDANAVKAIQKHSKTLPKYFLERFI
jgi:ATP-dependent DNA helicase DinG